MHQTSDNCLRTEGEPIEEELFFDLAARCMGVLRDQLLSALEQELE